MKKSKYTKHILAATIILTLFFAGCYEFDFINQPYQADPNTFFEAQIGIRKDSYAEYDGYFGVTQHNAALLKTK